MDHDERIKALEGQLEEEETKIKGLFLAGKVPTPGDYAETDRIRRDLKTARRVRAMEAKRVDPKLTRKVTLMLSEEEFQELTKEADETGVDLSKHIRALLKSRSRGGGRGSL